MPSSFAARGFFGPEFVPQPENLHRVMVKSTLLERLSCVNPALRLCWEDVPRAPAGLKNKDYSCYQNSILQAMASSKHIREFLLKTRLTSKKPKGSKELSDASDNAETITTALLTLVNELNNDSNRGQTSTTPPKLKFMSSVQQQDAQEYFSSLFDSIEKETKASFIKAFQRRDLTDLIGVASPREHLQLRRERARKLCHVETSCDDIFGRLKSPVEGLHAQQVACNSCGYSDELSMAPFKWLTLPLGDMQAYDIEQCLREYTEPVLVDGVECVKCSLKALQVTLQNLRHEALQQESNHEALLRVYDERLSIVDTALLNKDFTESTLTRKCGLTQKQRINTVKSKQVVVSKAPECLVLHFNRSRFDRYSSVATKNHADVRFPSMLDLSNWCLSTQQQSATGETRGHMDHREVKPLRSIRQFDNQEVTAPKVWYELRSVVVHSGKHESGHYVCFKKHPVLFDDADLENFSSLTIEDFKQRSGKLAWWRCSDEHVTEVTESYVLTQSDVFMLFYEKIEESNHPSPSMASVSTPPDTDKVELTHVDADEVQGQELRAEIATVDDNENVEAISVAAPSTVDFTEVEADPSCFSGEDEDQLSQDSFVVVPN